MEERISKTLEALKKNNMDAFYVETAERAKELALSMIGKDDTVSSGGSVTLSQIGIIEALKKGGYRYIERSAGLTPEEKRTAAMEAAFSDWFLSSSNAITEKGELYNVDGRSNRVSALLYGPSHVIIVAGKNKLTKDLDEAVLRVKKTAAPMNCRRLNIASGCFKTGKCVSCTSENMTDGCHGAGRICCNYTVMAQQRDASRIKVIIVGEELGY